MPHKDKINHQASLTPSQLLEKNNVTHELTRLRRALFFKNTTLAQITRDVTQLNSTTDDTAKLNLQEQLKTFSEHLAAQKKRIVVGNVVGLPANTLVLGLAGVMMLQALLLMGLIVASLIAMTMVPLSPIGVVVGLGCMLAAVGIFAAAIGSVVCANGLHDWAVTGLKAHGSFIKAWWRNDDFLAKLRDHVSPPRLAKIEDVDVWFGFTEDAPEDEKQRLAPSFQASF